MGINYMNDMNYKAPIMSNNSNQFFPQPQGSVFIVNSLSELDYAPMVQGVTAIICPSEKVLYIKTIQNSIPMTLVYKLMPYEDVSKMENKNEVNIVDYEKRIKKLEDKIKSLDKKGGHSNEFDI